MLRLSYVHTLQLMSNEKLLFTTHIIRRLRKRKSRACSKNNQHCWCMYIKRGKYQKSLFLFGIRIYNEVPWNFIHRWSQVSSSILRIHWEECSKNQIEQNINSNICWHLFNAYHADDIGDSQVFLQFPNQIHPLHWPKVIISNLRDYERDRKATATKGLALMSYTMAHWAWGVGM